MEKNVAPIDVKRLYFRIAEQLLNDIEDGEFSVGDRLPSERELADQYNVSRPTIREAIIALEVQGFVKVKTGSGVYITHNPDTAIGISNIKTNKPFEILEARMALEPEICALAASRVGAQELFEMQRLLRKMEQQFESAPIEAMQTDNAFHDLIVTAARNDALTEAIHRLWQQTERYDAESIYLKVLEKYSAQPVIDSHNEIMTALTARDPELARKAAYEHCQLQIRLYMEFTLDQPVVAQSS